MSFQSMSDSRRGVASLAVGLIFLTAIFGENAIAGTQPSASLYTYQPPAENAYFALALRAEELSAELLKLIDMVDAL